MALFRRSGLDQPRCRGCTWPGAACTRGRGCRWRRCRAAWRPRCCWRTSIRPAGPAGGLSLVVRRRPQRRRPARADDHRLRRQRLLALLPLRRAGAAAAMPSNHVRPQRGAVRPRHAALDHDRARPRPAVAQRQRAAPSARAACTGTGRRCRSTSTRSAAPLPRRVRGRVRVHPQGLCRFVAPLDAAGRHRWGPIAPCARIEVELDQPGAALERPCLPRFERRRRAGGPRLPHLGLVARAACATAAPR